jgi:plastocyanin
MFLVNSFRGMVRWAAAYGPGLPGISKQPRRLLIKPRLVQGSLVVFLAALTGMLVWLVPVTSADDEPDRRAQTYTVLVSAEDVSEGATVNAFFPDTLRIHVGDTVHWQRNGNEIHTVTFLAGTPLPDLTIDAPPGLPSPRMRNPLIAFPVTPADGRYDGTTFATSGIFGPDPDIFQGVESFDLTFTRRGTYNYVCVVHGVGMSGQIIVVDRDRDIPSPREVDRRSRRLIAAALAQAPAAIAQGNAEVPPPTPNPDGTTTYHVLVGFNVGQLALFHFFPEELTVQPGDTVEWTFSMEDGAPHTITFLNGEEAPDDLIVWPQKEGPPLLLVNPEVLFPQNPGQPLTREGVRSSGVLRQDVPPPSFSLEIAADIIGEEPYECLLHDSSGMLGTLHIVPR